MYVCSWKPKVKPLIPISLSLSFLSLNFTFYLWCTDPMKIISEMPFQRRQTDSICFWFQGYFHSKSRYLAKSKSLFHNEGIGIEGWQMNRRGLFSGKMGLGPPIWPLTVNLWVRPTLVTKQFAALLLSDLSLQTIISSWLFWNQTLIDFRLDLSL